MVFTTTILVGCSNYASLQTYYVDNQESKNFISQDLPLSMLKIDQSSFTEEQKEAYKSVRKLNFLGYKINANNIEAYNAEITKVKAILSNEKYNDLMEFSDKGNKIYVKFVGDEYDADEIVIFGTAKPTGFGIIRILGDDMNPEKMVTLINALQNANIGESQIEHIVNFFK